MVETSNIKTPLLANLSIVTMTKVASIPFHSTQFHLYSTITKWTDTKQLYRNSDVDFIPQ